MFAKTEGTQRWTTMRAGHVIVLLMEHWYSWILLWVFHAWLWCGLAVIIVFRLVWTIDAFTAPLPSCHGNVHNVQLWNGCATGCRDWTATTNLQSFKTLFAHRSLRSEIMEVSLRKTYLWMQQLLLDTLKYKDCNFEFRHFFANFGLLRSQRPHAPNQQCRKELSLQIRSLHRKEVRTCKSQSLTERLAEVSKWKCKKNCHWKMSLLTC